MNQNPFRISDRFQRLPKLHLRIAVCLPDSCSLWPTIPGRARERGRIWKNRSSKYDKINHYLKKKTNATLYNYYVFKIFLKVSLLVWRLLESLFRGLNDFTLFLIISRHNLREHLHVVFRQMQLDGLARTDLELRQDDYLHFRKYT